MINTLPLFRPLNRHLIQLLSDLTPEEWNVPTCARSWTVRDVAAHLLDGNMRSISIYRDQHAMKPASPPNSYGELVAYLNEINREWVVAMRRLSTRLLVDWLDKTHEDYIRCLERLDLHADAIFAVSWAGETRSPNWFHIAREYTEKWHHQQQIWDAVKKSGILTPEFYPLVLETFMKALPYRYRDLSAIDGTILEIIIPTEAGGRWQLLHTKNQWNTVDPETLDPDTVITIPLDVSWKLFTKAMTNDEARKKIIVEGDIRLAEPLLQMITVMA